MVDKEKILAGRKAVDAYREAHAALHKRLYYRGVHADHTPLLKAMVKALEGLGFSSAETDFEARKTEILANFWAESDELNVRELGFRNRKEFGARATDADQEALEAMWH